MLREAADDKNVVSIKMTLYRVAKHSEVVEALCEAAENGKDVLVLVELKARFDEEIISSGHADLKRLAVLLSMVWRL